MVVNSVVMPERERERELGGISDKRNSGNTYSKEKFRKEAPFHIPLEIHKLEGQLLGLALEYQNANKTVDPYWIIKTLLGRVYMEMDQLQKCIQLFIQEMRKKMKILKTKLELLIMMIDTPR